METKDQSYYYKWYPLYAGILNAPKPPLGPYALLDARALNQDEFFRLMRWSALGQLMRTLGKQMLAGARTFPIPEQRSPYQLVHRICSGRTKRSGRPALPKLIKETVLSAGRCATCQGDVKLTVDHIIAYSKGGPTELWNLQCLCRSCNSRKGAK